MLVAEVSGPGELRLRERPEPVAMPGTAVVAITRSGISGADVHAWRTGRTSPGAAFGTEWVGRVVAVGPGAMGRFEGERVVLGALPPCGTCGLCRRGDSRLCSTALEAALGVGPQAPDHGGFAPRIRVDARRLARLPEGLDDDDAVLAPAASVAAHAVAGTGQRLGDVVAVIGGGTLGLMTAEFARLAGSRRVVVVEPDPARRELACSLGADAAFATPGRDAVGHLLDLSWGLGADVVYECSGDGDAVAAALALVRRGGRITVLGAAPELRLDPVSWLLKEVAMTTSVGFGVEELSRTLDLLAEDRLRVGPLHQDQPIPLGELPARFGDVALGRGAVKTLVDPGD